MGIWITFVSWLVHAGEMDGWYAFTPANKHNDPSAIGMEAWSTEPAGLHGRVLAKGDKLFYNGEEIKLWGLNNSYGTCAPDKELANRRAAFYRKFGFNAIRLHKYADGTEWAGIQSADSFLEFNPAGLDRMDYFIAKLKENGIYTKLSPTFGVKFGQKELDKVPYYAELGEMKKGRISADGCWAHMAVEIGDLQIAQTVGVLNHKNPYTGLRYADDPAIFCVELFNEASILFYDANRKLQSSPTMRGRHGKGFSEWLKTRYENEESWRAAWGGDVIISDPSAISNPDMKNLIKPDEVKGSLAPESLSAGTVIPWGTSWFYDAALNAGSPQAVLKQRMLDTMQYLIGVQNGFYSRFVKAIRATGYTGEIIGSNWQAGNDVGHLLNLHSDSLVGPVDRHNYFGGGRGAFRNQKPFKDGSMLAVPGMGLQSAGFQQVEGRPFMFSEWIHVQPNEWYAEGPAILGAYGWGLQGWDIAYIFQNGDDGGFSKKLGQHEWDVANPAVMASYAAISRQVRRFDVKEAPETKHLNVHLPSIKEGRLSFRGLTKQSHDVKSFMTDQVPMNAMAATRVAVSFNDSFEPTPELDMSPYFDGDTIVSSTKQLRWTPAPKGEGKGGYFTMNTSGTKAFVGFAPGDKTFDLGDGFAITPEKGFAVIYLTARNPDETLANASEIVVTAMARTRNTGMQFNEKGNAILAKGDAPLLMEPIRATIQLPFNGKLEVLDQDGNQSLKSRPFEKAFRIDGTQDQTPFYLIRK
jgi:hypothetical protein